MQSLVQKHAKVHNDDSVIQWKLTPSKLSFRFSFLQAGKLRYSYLPTYLQLSTILLGQIEWTEFLYYILRQAAEIAEKLISPNPAGKLAEKAVLRSVFWTCLLYTSPSPRDS